MIQHDSISAIKQSVHRGIVLIWLIFVLPGPVFSQPVVFNGVIRDRETLEPVSGVNIRIEKSDQGTCSNDKGEFSFSLPAIPCTITFSCVGYESLTYEMTSPPVKPVSIFLQKSTLLLREIDIRANRFQYLFRDEHYSILDYEILDSNLLLLVFRYRLKNTELILLTLQGDTLAKVPVPELKPVALYKDCLDHVHYFSSAGNAFQCRYDHIRGILDFPYHTTRDSLLRLTRPFLFRMGDRLYFEEFTADGLGKNIGYCDGQGNKRYIISIQDDHSRTMFRDDVMFNNLWNNSLLSNQHSLSATAVPETGSGTGSRSSPLSMIPVTTGQDILASTFFHYQPIRAPLIKLGESMIAVFDVPGKTISLFTPDGRPERSLPLRLNPDGSENLMAGLLATFIPMQEWEWTGAILADGMKGEAYTTYKKNGMVQVRHINLINGEEENRIILSFPLPEKIRILNGNAYFLVKEPCADFPRRRLISQTL